MNKILSLLLSLACWSLISAFADYKDWYVVDDFVPPSYGVAMSRISSTPPYGVETVVGQMDWNAEKGRYETSPIADGDWPQSDETIIMNVVESMSQAIEALAYTALLQAEVDKLARTVYDFLNKKEITATDENGITKTFVFVGGNVGSQLPSGDSTNEVLETSTSSLLPPLDSRTLEYDPYRRNISLANIDDYSSYQRFIDLFLGDVSGRYICFPCLEIVGDSENLRWIELSPHSCQANLAGIIAGKSSADTQNRSSHRFLALKSNGELHAVPAGEILDVSAIKPDGSSIVTNSSSVVSMAGFGNASNMQFPVKHSNALEWISLVPGDGVSITNGAGGFVISATNSPSAFPTVAIDVITDVSYSTNTHQLLARKMNISIPIVATNSVEDVLVFQAIPHNGEHNTSNGEVLDE